MSSFLFGTPSSFERQNLLSDQQMPLQQQLMQAGLNRGAGGASGQAADYYRDLLSDDNSTMDAFAAPEMRRLRTQILPGIAEQFAGMGSGGLESGSFRNSAMGAGTDLAERIASIRAGLRQNAAQSLMGIGQAGLNPYTSVMYRPRAPGFLESAASGIGTGLGMAMGGSGMGAGIGAGLKGLGGALSSLFQRGSPNPYTSNSLTDTYNTTSLPPGSMGQYNPYSGEMGN